MFFYILAACYLLGAIFAANFPILSLVFLVGCLVSFSSGEYLRAKEKIPRDPRA